MADAFTKRAGGGGAARTSQRHADILNAYQAGDSRWLEWTRAHLGDLELVSWSHGRVSLIWRIDDRFVMPDGVMFGGHIASVADHVGALVTMSVLEDAAERFRTSRLETNFFRPVMKPSVRIEGRAVNAGSTLIQVEADFLNAEDKLAVRVAAVQVRRRVGATA